MSDERRRAVHEASHVVLAESHGASVGGVWLAEDSALTHIIDQEALSADATVEVALAGVVGELLDEDKTFNRWTTIATWLTETSAADGKLVRAALVESGRKMTRKQAVVYLAGVAERVAGTLRENRRELKLETDTILRGDRTPTTRGGYTVGADGRPVYFGASATQMPGLPSDVTEVEDAFLPEPEPPKRNVRTLFGLRKNTEGTYEITEDEVAD